MSDLAQRSCEPCRGGVPAMSKSDIDPLLAQLDGWQVVDFHHLTKTYRFDDFAQGLDFVNLLGAVAEREGHHPDLHLSWGQVRVDIWTHKIDGLTESDFVLAAKSDEMFRMREQMFASGDDEACACGGRCAC
ncbi:MAG: 4a-hydroxytetrahydrobiopterin dehydratase [Pseudomonadota bacterium]